MPPEDLEPATSNPGDVETSEDVETGFNAFYRKTVAELDKLTVADWQLISQTIGQYAVGTIRLGSRIEFEQRVDWVLGKLSPKPNFDAYDLIGVLGYIGSADDPLLISTLQTVSELTGSRIVELSSIYGDWLSDLVFMRTRGFRDWTTLDHNFIVSKRSSDPILTLIQIARQDGNVFDLQMTISSVANFANRLIAYADEIVTDWPELLAPRDRNSLTTIVESAEKLRATLEAETERQQASENS